MKLRWRALTREQLESGDVRGAVTVSRNEHYSHVCVLEFQSEDQTNKDWWYQIPMYFPGGKHAT